MTNTIKLELSHKQCNDLLSFISRLNFQEVSNKALSDEEKHSFLITLEEVQYALLQENNE